MVDFGNKLKELRRRTDMTQQELADRLGVTKSVVSYYELQERTPSPEILVKMAAIFRVTTDFLLGLAHESMLDVSDLSEGDIRAVYAIIESLRKK